MTVKNVTPSRKDRKRNNLYISKPKYDSAGFARRIIFGFYLICDPYSLPSMSIDIKAQELALRRGTPRRNANLSLGRQ